MCNVFELIWYFLNMPTKLDQVLLVKRTHFRVKFKLLRSLAPRSTLLYFQADFEPEYVYQIQLYDNICRNLQAVGSIFLKQMWMEHAEHERAQLFKKIHNKSQLKAWFPRTVKKLQLQICFHDSPDQGQDKKFIIMPQKQMSSKCTLTGNICWM